MGVRLVMMILGICLGAGMTAAQALDKASPKSGAKVLMWDDLADMDYKTGRVPKNLADVDKKVVRIPGFIVPLEDNMKQLTEFLLVPYPQACIHVPPPPPNQMVLVRAPAGKEFKYVPYPVWVEGTLEIGSKGHAFGKSSFGMTAQSVERYRE